MTGVTALIGIIPSDGKVLTILHKSNTAAPHSMVTGSRRLWLLLRNNNRAMCGTESPIKATGPQYAVTVAVSNPVERSSRLRVIFMLMPKFSAYRAPKSIALRGFTSNAEIKRPASDNEANSGSCCNVTLPKFPNPHMV